MSLNDSLIAPLAALIGRLIPDPAAADAARLALLGMDGSPEIARIATVARAAGAQDRWVSRARPCFLYVMYAILLWALPMGLIAAISSEVALRITRGMIAYLGGIPEPLYTLFGTGYLGYTAARQWGKVAGSDK